MSVNPALTTLRGLLVYAVLILFCLCVWAAVVVVVVRYGWMGGLALAVSGLALADVLRGIHA